MGFHEHHENRATALILKKRKRLASQLWMNECEVSRICIVNESEMSVFVSHCPVRIRRHAMGAASQHEHN